MDQDKNFLSEFSVGRMPGLDTVRVRRRGRR
jgi:hypothetical protein